MKIVALLLFCPMVAVSQVNYTGTAYTQNFDVMGAAGTVPPAGWSVKNGAGAAATWGVGTGIAGSGVAAMVAAAGALTPSAVPATGNNDGFNAQVPGDAGNRVLATSPTGVAGVALQLALTNGTAASISALRVSYDIRRFTAATAENELPGYWLFVSTDAGVTWSNVDALNPATGSAAVVVPNTVGVTLVRNAVFSLPDAWNPGATLLLRWVDDNSAQTSPDQIFGLDNVSISQPVGQVPGVAITAPAGGSVFVVGDTINLTADANDGDGDIVKVEFFQGETKLGEDLVAPYDFAWTGAAAGNYTLTARATDDDGNPTDSIAISVFVNPTAGSGTLTRGPYLQKAAPNGMTIRWRSSDPVEGRVRYGTNVANLTSIADESSPTTEHIVELTGLSVNTTYYYSIGSATDTLASGVDYTFTTPPPAGSAVNTRVWVLGDAGTSGNSASPNVNQTAVRDAFYTWTGARTPNLVLQLGDNAYLSGTDGEFQKAVFDIYGTMLRKTPFWSCLGNHETAQNTAFVDTYPYFNIYSFPTAGECGGIPSGTEHYYSFDYGNIHFISLDSMTASRAANGAMATWLQSDLASTTATWVVCFFHHPAYTKGSHDSDTETELIEMRENILPILEAGGVDLVLSGHSHCYERSYLLDGHYGDSTTLTPAMKKNAGDGRPAGNGGYFKPLTGPRDRFGAVYAVAGSSGQATHWVGGSTLPVNPTPHPAMYASLLHLGSLVLDVNGTRLDATFLRENSSTPDTFTIIKQGAADSDGDGVADAFEIANGMNRYDWTDALLDTDKDGNTALAEYLFGLNPQASDRYGWATARNQVTGFHEIAFPTLPQRVYQVFWSDDLASWHPGSVAVSGDGTTKLWIDDGTVTGSVPSLTARRFYRVRVVNGP